MNKSSAVAEMNDRFATIDMGRKVGEGGCCAPFRGGAGSHLTHCRLDRGQSSYQVASWSIQPFGHNTPTLQTDRTDGQTGHRCRSKRDRSIDML